MANLVEDAFIQLLDATSLLDKTLPTVFIICKGGREFVNSNASVLSKKRRVRRQLLSQQCVHRHMLLMYME